jgi:hypothetical protein
VTGFDLTDINVTNGNPQALTQLGPEVYRLEIDVSFLTLADVTVNVPAGGANDLIGNASLLSNTLNISVVRTAPTATMNYFPSSVSLTQLGTVQITFSEPVTGLTIGNFMLDRGGLLVDLTNAVLTGSGANYQLDLGTLPAIPGNYTLVLDPALGQVIDVDGNMLLEPTQVEWTVG